ncbi:MAG: serine protease, partial [Verrucomicrobia bacterium]|nr:serine protease [Verrucomicrobiota bacterium]
FAVPVFAQQVGLPAPRLLTVTPMGGQVGTSVEVSVTHQNIESASELLFSTPKITATPVLASDGKIVPNKFLVTIAPDAPPGVHDARVLSRLGISSARAFSVGSLPEVTRLKANNSVETALALPVNSVCNATTSKKAIDFYSFQGVKDGRVSIDCAAMGIDSKLNPVVIVADSKGHDLLVNRTAGALDFTPPSDGTYLIKIHGLTFQGGPEYFYRLALQEVSGTGLAPAQDATQKVSAFSWPPEGLPASAQASEIEPNDAPAQAQKITLPCDISGSFFPANDVDIFEFSAKKGEVWWVEVASERLGQSTDPFALVQRVSKTGDKETLTDVGELDDVASPMKPGTYVPAGSYNGPPYDAGSPDALGKIEIKEDGVYRLQLHDLLGGTRSDAGNVYRLVIRQAAPDFALVAWAAHLTVRQNDFGTISKPIALRAGTTMAFEVVVLRRDGFDGEIELAMEDLPAGVTATGLKIPAGKVQG